MLNIFNWNVLTLTLPTVSRGGEFSGDILLPVKAQRLDANIPSVVDTTLVILPEIASALLVAGNILVLIFAFCGGCAAIVVCSRSKFARPGTRFILISLAISDFILASFSIVESLAFILHKYHSWNLGEFMCIISDYVQTCAMLTSGCCIIGIAVDRYLAVVRGLKTPCLGPRWSSYCSYIFMILIWLAPIAIPIPLLLNYYIFPFMVYSWSPEDGMNVSDNVTYYICAAKPEKETLDRLYNGVLGLLFLCLIITFIFSYVSIMIFIKRNFSRRPGDVEVVATSTSGTPNNNNMGEISTTSGITITGNNNSQQQQPQPQTRHRRTVRLIMVLIILFVVCRVPVWIFRILMSVGKIKHTVTNVTISRSLVLLSNIKCAINPFLYTIKNDALRSPNQGTPGNQETNCCGFGQNKFKCQFSWRIIRDGCCWNKGNLTSYDFTRETRGGPSMDTQRFYTSDKTEPPLKNSSLWKAKNDFPTTVSSG